jgi:hypothetical protein
VVPAAFGVTGGTTNGLAKNLGIEPNVFSGLDDAGDGKGRSRRISVLYDCLQEQGIESLPDYNIILPIKCGSAHNS